MKNRVVSEDATDGVRTWVATEGGQRLDQHVAAVVTGLSRSQAQRLIQAGDVIVNGCVSKPAALVRPGDTILVRLPAATDSDVAAEPLQLIVCYESEHMVVLDKPAGILVHPTSAVRSGTLVSGMLWRYPEIAEVGTPGRRGVVHRLDKGTSGLVVFGRTIFGLRSLQEQFRKHLVWKTYLALVVGQVEPERGVVDAPVGRHPRERSRMAVVRQGGRPARTQYETVQVFKGYSLVQAHPLTGRTHQIRVHFAALGHPIAGDPIYGRGAADLGLARQFLHAQGLRLTDPGTGQMVELESPLPDELRRVLDHLAQLGERAY
ncbi:MAG: RluA family pseudouridine synthase [Anaerolineae bacterium]